MHLIGKIVSFQISLESLLFNAQDENLKYILQNDVTLDAEDQIFSTIGFKKMFQD